MSLSQNDVSHVTGGNTALMVCASEGDIDNAKLQLANGADINARNEQGSTALLIAVLNNEPSMVSLLLENGADASIATKKGMTPKALAKKNGNKEIVYLLDKNNSKNIKWLQFWTYVELPIGSLLLFAGYIQSPTTISMVIRFPILFLQCSVIYGIYHRKLWAWKWNWVIIGLATLSAFSSSDVAKILGHSTGSEYYVLVAVVLVVSGLWLWANVVYWNKRRHLFS